MSQSVNLFESIMNLLINEKCFSLIDLYNYFNNQEDPSENVIEKLNAGFLILLAGEKNTSYNKVKTFFSKALANNEYNTVTRFYLDAVEQINKEIYSVCKSDHDFHDKLIKLKIFLSDVDNLKNSENTIAHIWSVFFPEGVGILQEPYKAVVNLRNKRKVTIKEKNKAPLTDIANELLLTSNVMLTIPLLIDENLKHNFNEDFLTGIETTREEEQLYWYDHPIPIGIKPENNELIYGLKNLESAITFEKTEGTIPEKSIFTSVLSTSVTHKGLQQLSKQYIQKELNNIGGLKNINVYIFTESDTCKIVEEVLLPALYYYNISSNDNIFEMFGVDGEYGKHYTFLKAISAFWQVFINPFLKATFKIDLDQVFPEKELKKETGLFGFEHFKTDLWGAKGEDSDGKPVDFGMIAGALVNAKDIVKSIYTADVPWPEKITSPDEFIFYSKLPQALSTEAEIMTRYNTNELDGDKYCIKRVHVTGGTNGILVSHLFKYRPFTPSFIGRAEDQAFIMSCFSEEKSSLSYLHKDGLIMRHDKEIFAGEAIEKAYTGKLLGDYIRILYFSAYAKVLSPDLDKIKNELDPFTGCFISKISLTVIYLRFALKAASFFNNDKDNQGLEFIRSGSKRIKDALRFIGNDERSNLKEQYEREKTGWNIYYDILLKLKGEIHNRNEFACELQKKAEIIIENCKISFDSADK